MGAKGSSEKHFRDIVLHFSFLQSWKKSYEFSFDMYWIIYRVCVAKALSVPQRSHVNREVEKQMESAQKRTLRMWSTAGN